MRIAVFTNQFPAKVCTFFARDIRSLLETGNEVDIFPIYPLNPKLWGCIPAILNEGVFSRSQVHHISIQKSLIPTSNIALAKLSGYFQDLCNISFSAIRYGFVPLAKSIYASIKALGWAKENKKEYDHILAYWGNYAATCAYLFYRLTDRSTAFSMFLRAGTDLYRDQVFLKQKLLYADNIFVECEFNRQFIKNLYPSIFPQISSKIHLYYLGLDLAELHYSPGNRERGQIVAVGNLTKVKGFDYLLYAAQELVSRGFNIEVDLVGDGEEKTALKALAIQLGIADRVKFLGWLTFEKVKSVMSHATLLVHPSCTIGDAVPTVIKEAMALGTPVIASNVAGIPELLDNGMCGILVPPGDSKALADAIGELVQNEPLRRCYAESGRRFTEEKYDLWKNGRTLTDLMRNTSRH
jgi:glycosyltransferase involved in cell wall biosynthesis